MSHAHERRQQLPLLLERAKITLPLGVHRKPIVELLAQLLVAALEATPTSAVSEVAHDEDA